jgi:2-hydroxychromene-2-carboxylate isomerase
MTDTKTIEFVFDFASPNAYFVHKALPTYLADHDVEVRYVPALLGGIFKLTGNSAPMVAFADIKGKMEYEHLEISRFIKKHRLSNFRMNTHFPVNTITMMRGATFAQDKGWYMDYVSVCFEAMWEGSLLMSDPEVMTKALEARNLDAGAILAACQEQTIKDRLMQTTHAVVQRGVFGIPTVFIGEEMFFGKERLAQIAETLA